MHNSFGIQSKYSKTKHFKKTINNYKRMWTNVPNSCAVPRTTADKVERILQLNAINNYIKSFAISLQ